MRGQPLSGKALKNLNRQTIQRLMQYISKYKLPFIAVAVCIIISSVASVVASRFLQTLIDDYIEPLLLQPVPNFSGPVADAVPDGCGPIWLAYSQRCCITASWPLSLKAR